MKLIIKILCILILSISFSCCKKEYQKEEKIEEVGSPQLATGWHRAIIKVSIKNNNLDCYGICYAEEKVTSMPTIGNDTVHLNMEGGATLSNLKDAITYYWRIFIQIEDTIIYSDVQKFTTLKFPTISTSATNITSNSAILHGTFKEGYNAACTKHILYYALGSSDTVRISTTGNENFVVNITDLEYNTTYHACAYVENSIGEKVYGNTVNFTTLPYQPQCPEVITLNAENVTYSTAVLWGEITEVGDPAYTERGIVYARHSNPTIENGDMLTVSGNGLGKFNATTPSLSSGALYYFRAYVKSSVCSTCYGSIDTFRTEKVQCPEVETLHATDITVTTAKLWGIILNAEDGYTEKGIIFADFQNIDLNNGHVISVDTPCDENGFFYGNTGIFLTPGGTYYYRAYVKLAGCETDYGEIKSFTTLP